MFLFNHSQPSLFSNVVFLWIPFCFSRMEEATSVPWMTPMTTCCPCGTGRRKRGWRMSRSLSKPHVGLCCPFPMWSLPLLAPGQLSVSRWAVGSVPATAPRQDPFTEKPLGPHPSPHSQGLVGFLLLITASIRVFLPHFTVTTLLIRSVAHLLAFSPSSTNAECPLCTRVSRRHWRDGDKWDVPAAQREGQAGSRGTRRAAQPAWGLSRAEWTPEWGPPSGALPAVGPTGLSLCQCTFLELSHAFLLLKPWLDLFL